VSAAFDLPLSVDELRDAVAAGRTFGYRAFWRIDADDGRADDRVFSQWWPSPFTVDGQRYATAEHFMMAEKARLMGDETTRARILSATDPRTAKKLGRAVAPWDEARWVAARFDIVTAASLAKFTSTPELRAHLLSTDDAILVEASPLDRIWGIGLGPRNPAVERPAEWKGLNLLGFALVRARAILRGQLPPVVAGRRLDVG
jgi:hypothetical protein